MLTDLVDKETAAKGNKHAPSTSVLTTPSRNHNDLSGAAAFGTPHALPATPTDAAGLPTPAGTVGRAGVPPTPSVSQNTAELGPASSAQALAWRSRAHNAAFKGRSPPSSR